MTVPGDRLRQAGLRVTAARLAVLDIVERSPHLPAPDIARLARERLGSLSTQAVYETLRAMTAANLLRSIAPAGSPSRYEARVGDNHHHVVCRGCGLTVDIDCAVGRAPCLDPGDHEGFLLDEAEVTWWGLCPACADGRDGDPPTSDQARADRLERVDRLS